MQTFIKRLVPFIVLGMVFVLLAFSFMLFVYLFIFGAIVGTILFITQWIRNKWLQNNHSMQHTEKHKTRIIDVKDWKRH